jgi:hypothetical protein
MCRHRNCTVAALLRHTQATAPLNLRQDQPYTLSEHQKFEIFSKSLENSKNFQIYYNRVIHHEYRLTFIIWRHCYGQRSAFGRLSGLGIWPVKPMSSCMSSASPSSLLCRNSNSIATSNTLAIFDHLATSYGFQSDSFV